jgi:hypothetical protein
MRKLRRHITSCRVNDPDGDPKLAFDELTENLAFMGVSESDIVAVNLEYKCNESDMSHHWRATITAIYWTNPE